LQYLLWSLESESSRKRHPGSGRLRPTRAAAVAIILASSLLAPCCGGPSRRAKDWSLGPGATFTATISGKGPELVLAPPGPIPFPVPVPSTPLVARVGEAGAGVRLREPDPGEDDAALAFRLASVVHRVLREEVGIERPALYVILFPVPGPRPVRVTVPLPQAPGLAVGIPSIEGKLQALHASLLLYLLAHESTESFLVFPAVGGGARLYGDPDNRWIGEGMANLAAAIAMTGAARDGAAIAPVGHLDPALAERRKGRQSIALRGWRQGQLDEGRYSAAEFLCDRWYRAARERGRRRPIADFAAWLRTFPDGPRHRQVLDWLAETSGLDIGREAEGIPVDDVIRYHAAAWAARGWEVPPEAAALDLDR
jgi:hypothetical protein